MTFPPQPQRRSWFPSPWPCFIVFILANTLLSYFSLDWRLKCGIGAAGLLIPFFLLFRHPHPSPVEEPKGLQGEAGFNFPAIFWVILLFAAVFVHFYRLTTLSTWPFVDEGYLGYYAVELSEKWNWHLLYGYVQFPPLYYWCLGLFFKILGPSLGNLWLLPALLSLLALPLVYLASRRFFPKPLCMMMTAFWAFGFWPLFLGRLCLGQGLLILWQLAAFMALGHFLRQETPPSQKRGAFFLGLVTGTGFYVLLHWPLMALWIFLVAVYPVFRNRSGPFRVFPFFLLPAVLIPLPLLAAYLFREHGTYFHFLSIFNKDFSWPHQFQVWWGYVSALFWGARTAEYGYKPVWGGFLNPVAGSLFFLGFAEVCRGFKKGMNASLLLGFALFMIPAFLTWQFEALRIVLVLPLLVVVCAWGARQLLEGFSPAARKTLFGILLTLTAALDGYHLAGPYQQLWRSDWDYSNHATKSLDHWQAFQILSSMEKQSGPGLILTEFGPSPFDQTLTTALYPFNAARNPFLSPLQARWAGLLTNINYAPFLSKRFPHSKWFPLAPGQDLSRAALVLGIIPVEPANQGILIHWLEVERALRSETFQWLQLPMNQANPGLGRELSPILPMAAKDPFLESCVGERIFYNEMTVSDSKGVYQALHRALTLGYPAANLWNDLGVYYFTAGNPAKAREAFEAALHSPINHTSAWDNLQKVPRP
jgi:4-amino-4-deoxy-L-arabinose transferase-like glycosyltransferase